MMISPDMFIESCEEMTFQQLIVERKRLCRDIAGLEKIVYDKENPKEAYCVHPSPDVQYQMELEYLAELCKFLKGKYCKEIVWGEE